jgi:hypothetical protein
LIGTTHINKINKKKKNTIGKVPKSNRKMHFMVKSIPEIIKWHISGNVPKNQISMFLQFTYLKKRYFVIFCQTLERGRIDTPNIQIHDRLLSWLGTGTSVNNNIF